MRPEGVLFEFFRVAGITTTGMYNLFIEEWTKWILELAFVGYRFSLIA